MSRDFSRQVCWSGLPFPSPGHIPDPGIESGSPSLQAYFLLSESLGKPLAYWSVVLSKKEGFFLVIYSRDPEHQKQCLEWINCCGLKLKGHLPPVTNKHLLSTHYVLHFCLCGNRRMLTKIGFVFSRGLEFSSVLSPWIDNFSRIRGLMWQLSGNSGHPWALRDLWPVQVTDTAH